jgi:hypothetical protein
VIESGLAIGERVVTDGQFKLKPGAKVAVTTLPAASAPPPTVAEKTAKR